MAILQGYHAHVYFNVGTRMQADRIHKLCLTELVARWEVYVGPLETKMPRGPHPLPMFELNFSTEHRTEVVKWLEKNREGLSVLVHEVTGDDFRDHTHGAFWLGKDLGLDLEQIDNSIPTRVRKPLTQEPL